MSLDREKQETCVFKQKGKMARQQEPSSKETCTKQAAITLGAPAFALLALATSAESWSQPQQV